MPQLHRDLQADRLRIGLIGVGVGARQLLPALSSGAHSRLVAAADLRLDALERLARDFGVATYTSVEDLVRNPEVEAVWVATPNHLHAEHAIAALEACKHVIVSKPMSVTLEESRAMNAAARRNGVLLLAGHTQSMAPSIRKMAEMVRTAELGKLGMLHTWHFTDWMYRPRLPAELDVAQGGGPVFRQASHQVDIVRSIAGSPVRSVRASIVQLDESRGAPGAYTAYLEFASDVPATIVYSGYGHFAMDELVGRQVTRSGPVMDDAAAKEALRNATVGSNSLGLFGLTLATCEHGDIRESPEGLLVHERDGCRTVPLVDEQRGAAELEELYNAVRRGQALTHDGVWGQTTLQVCLAIHESARTHAEIQLT
jgi:phthalate 4,5-cis-dihydrodiol dehydrogenase